MKKPFFLLLITFFVFSFVQTKMVAQTAIGTWRDHFSYYRGISVEKANNKVFCATPSALFHYNLDDNSVEKLSITNGLSDIGPCAMAFNTENNLLLVAYENANIDFIQGNTISNLSDIKNKAIQGNKKINHIEFNGNLAYLACGFGIVVIDIEKREVSETYYIGPDASNIEVYSIAFDNNNIYAATASGLYFANKADANLADYNNWEKDNNLIKPDGKYTSVINFESQILATYLNNAEDSSIIYRQNGQIWDEVYNEGTVIKNISQENGLLFISEPDKVKILNANLTISEVITEYSFGAVRANDCTKDGQGNIYLADRDFGLVIYNNNSYRSVVPNGPFNNDAFDVAADNNMVWVAGGGRTSAWGNMFKNTEAYLFSNESWKSFILLDPSVLDFVKILINPQNPQQIFAASWGGGILVYENNKHTATYDVSNSSLQSIIAGDVFVRIGGLALDESQNLYATNSGVGAPISIKTADDDWYSYNYPSISGYEAVGEIIITQYGHKWIQLGRGGGLFAFDDNSTPDDMEDDQYRKFSIFDENGHVETNEVLSLIEDEEGVIWVGTDQGVFTYYNPQNVFSGENFYADRLKVVAKDSVVQYLLAKERVTAMAIDGANRKWFGTESSGAFLMSADGQTEIFHFNTENSKLISNSINSIAVDGKTGEVFFATSEGMVSFKGTATKGDASFSGAYVYPNPVREDYDGPITITGLAPNVNVKVTDISGQLVYETTAFGGQAIWDGKNFSGRKVNTGVYLVFCTDDEGDNKKILKLLVIN